MATSGSYDYNLTGTQIITEALEMIEATRSAKLLAGYRGRPAADMAALADVIARVSHLAYDLRTEVAAADVNPLMVLPAGQGVVAADALIVRSSAG